ERLPLANIFPEHAGKAAKCARMRVAFVRRTVEGVRAAVGADHTLRMREDALEIVLAHREADHADVSLTALEQRDGERVRLEVLRHRKAADALSLGRSIGVVGDSA